MQWYKYVIQNYTKDLVELMKSKWYNDSAVRNQWTCVVKSSTVWQTNHNTMKPRVAQTCPNNNCHYKWHTSNDFESHRGTLTKVNKCIKCTIVWHIFSVINTAINKYYYYYYYYYYYTCLKALCSVIWYQKRKPIWIYWSKSQWLAVASAEPYANLHLDPDR